MDECGCEHSLTLDNQAELDAALEDPMGFLVGLDGPVFVDEVQRAPGLLLAIKQRSIASNARASSC